MEQDNGAITKCTLCIYYINCFTLKLFMVCKIKLYTHKQIKI